MSTQETTTNWTPVPAEIPQPTIVVAPAAVSSTDNVENKEEKLVLAAPPQPPKPARKKRAPKHDFKDGRGRVFAHRHDNGRGWVADTAHVEEDCYIGSRAQVSQCAKVLGGARIEAKAHVGGRAIVTGKTVIRGEAVAYGDAQIHESEISGHVSIFGTAGISGSNISDRCRIAGNCVIRNSNLRGYITISGSPLLIAVTANGYIEISATPTMLRSVIQGLASIQGSSTIMDSRIHNFFWQAIGLGPEALMTAQIDRRCVVRVEETACLQNQTEIGAPVHIRGRSTLINCTLNPVEYGLEILHAIGVRRSGQDAVENQAAANYVRPDILNKTWRGATIRDRLQLDRLLAANETEAHHANMERINPRAYEEQYSVERLAPGRRLMPV